MRTPIPLLRPNGHPATGQIFAITGICQKPRFPLHLGEGDSGVVFLGAAQLGGEDEDAYLLLRRSVEGGAVRLVLRVEWEGVFSLLGNDDEAAEVLFQQWVAPAQPEEVQRQWTAEPATIELFGAWLEADS